MALINRRGSYQWKVRIRRREYPKQTKTFDIYEDAARWACKTEMEMDEGIFVSRKEAENTTLDGALDRRLAEGKSPYTVNNELILLSNLFNVAHREWNHLIIQLLKSHARKCLKDVTGACFLVKKNCY